MNDVLIRATCGVKCPTRSLAGSAKASTFNDPSPTTTSAPLHTGHDQTRAASARVGPSFDRASRTPRRAAIKVRGVIGESVEARFSIENSLDESAEVIIDAGTCRGPDGTGFSVPVELTPDALLMAPHSSDVVVARVHLADASFAPGCSYRLPISVHGPSPAIIDIEISIEEDRADKPGLTTDTERVGDDKASFTVRCPVCRRTFERTTASLVLRPHNDEWGAMCQERAGERVR